MLEVEESQERAEVPHASVEYTENHETSGKKDPNQDTLLTERSLNLYGAFDGVGGHADGDVASDLGANTVRGHYAVEGGRIGSPAEEMDSMRQAMTEANAAVFEHNSQFEGAKEKESHTTAAAIRLVPDPENGRSLAIVGTVGDSRVYVVREGKIVYVSQDQSAFEGDPGLQARLSEATDRDSLSNLDQAAFRFRAHLGDALGVKDPAEVDPKKRFEPWVEAVEVRPGDRVLVMTDGVHDNLTDSEIAALVTEAKTDEEVTEKLHVAAYNRSHGEEYRSKLDDISLISITIAGEAEEATDSDMTPTQELAA